MVTKVEITDNKNTPIGYLPELKAFKNGKVYEFREGVNIIVGENGCGKTTLLNLIRKYLLVDLSECSLGMYNSNINDICFGLGKKRMYDGAGVYADYQRNTFRLCHAGERKYNDEVFESDLTIAEFFGQKESSTGEGVLVALKSLFARMYNKGANLMFDYTQVGDNYIPYLQYVHDHVVEGNEWTILMDEPDRNLDIENISQVRGILSVHKPQTQIIAVVHNPLLICALSKNPEVNIIEMTRGYVKKVNKLVKELV